MLCLAHKKEQNQPPSRHCTRNGKKRRTAKPQSKKWCTIFLLTGTVVCLENLNPGQVIRNSGTQKLDEPTKTTLRYPIFHLRREMAKLLQFSKRKEKTMGLIR